MLLAVAILYYLKHFNEIIPFGLILDIYYGQFSPTFNPWDYKFTILFTILLLTSFFIKKRLKFYMK